MEGLIALLESKAGDLFMGWQWLFQWGFRL